MSAEILCPNCGGRFVSRGVARVDAKLGWWTDQTNLRCAECRYPWSNKPAPATTESPSVKTKVNP